MHDNTNNDRIINCNEESEMNEERPINHETIEEWVKPTDSFFANAQQSAWSSKSIVSCISFVLCYQYVSVHTDRMSPHSESHSRIQWKLYNKIIRQ